MRTKRQWTRNISPSWQNWMERRSTRLLLRLLPELLVHHLRLHLVHPPVLLLDSLHRHQATCLLRLLEWLLLVLVEYRHLLRVCHLHPSLQGLEATMEINSNSSTDTNNIVHLVRTTIMVASSKISNSIMVTSSSSNNNKGSRGNMVAIRDGTIKRTMGMGAEVPVEAVLEVSIGGRISTVVALFALRSFGVCVIFVHWKLK